MYRAFVVNVVPFPMKRTLTFGTRARRSAAVAAAAALAILPLTGAAASENIGLVMAASPSGVATNSVTMRIPAEATTGSVPLFISTSGSSTLFSVEFGATPLRDAEGGVTSVTPAFDRTKRTIPAGGELRRLDVSVSGLDALGHFTSTLYAKSGGHTQTLGTLTVVHTLRSGELAIASIARARGSQSFPGQKATITLLVTVRNLGDRTLQIESPVIERLTLHGAQAGRPVVRVTERDGSSPAARLTVPPRGSTTLRVLLTGIDKTGEYAGALRVAGDGTEPAEQTFAFDVKQGPLFPALLIAFGVVVAFGLRWLLSSGAVARAGRRRIAARLLTDIREARGVSDLEPREKRVLETLERRAEDVADELERARSTRRTGVLVEIDAKLDVFADLVAARRLVRAMKPAALQQPFERALTDGIALLAEETPAGDPRLAAAAATFAGLPAAVAAETRARFHADVDALLKTAESSPTISSVLPVRIVERIETSKRLADEGRFADAHAELGAAQLAFARALAEDFLERLPEADEPPPGFVTGWQKFRSQIADGLRRAARQRRGSAAADAYRVVWQTYATELAARLQAAAGRERRGAPAARKEQLASVVEACEEATAQATELDPRAVETFARALDSFLGGSARRSATRARMEPDRFALPVPLTVIAAGLKDAEPITRPAHDAARSASLLSKQIHRRHVGLAAVAAVVAIPSGLALFWAPNDVWGTFADGAAVFGWGATLTVVAAVADSTRLGMLAARDARGMRRSFAPAAEQAAPAPSVRTTGEPASDL